MRRLFWLAAGLSAGAIGAVMVARWMRRQQERLSPSHLGSQAAEAARDLRRLVRESLEVGREEMSRVEADIRASLPE